MQRLRNTGPGGTNTLPAVGTLINEPGYAALVVAFGRASVVAALRTQVETERNGTKVSDAERLENVEVGLRKTMAPALRRVINASGVILHTNLGRAPLSQAAVAAVAAAAAGYTNLELDLDTGRRGERSALVAGLLTALFECEAALVVNNCAAAVLLTLTALCKGREVIVSRGQLVEIGGSFRMPDVMRMSGARMVEVGTTNRTRATDFEVAMTPRTEALLRVHTSNFRVAGFTESARLSEMAAVSRAHNVLLIDDIGSGAIEPIGDEPTVAESLKHCDIATFSGDKLMGGPQAGIVLAATEAGAAGVRKMARHPLARAVRIDKLTLAALEATLKQRLSGRDDEIPVQRMLRVPLDEVRRRAALWSVKLADRGVASHLIPGESAVGGGAVPGHGIPTMLVALDGPASRLATALRRGDPPVIARIENAACCLDPRTVMRGEDETLIDVVEVAARSIRR